VDEKKKRERLHKVPMRTLVDSIKKDLRRQIRESEASRKSKKK